MSNVRVATWNVHGFCEGVETAVETAGPWLHNLDILALQEAPRHDIPGLCQLLSQMNDSSYDYACQHGTALVTRFPILEKVSQQEPRITLSHKKKTKGTSSVEGRHVSCRILLQDEPCTVVIAHLDHRSECRRLQEWEALLLAITGTNPQDLPRMILGDFNALTRSDYNTPEWREIVRIRELNNWEAPVTDLTDRVQALGYQDVRRVAHNQLGPVATSRFGTRIDYIYYLPRSNTNTKGGWKATECAHHVVSKASDHNLVVCTLSCG
mmetsp:Transcript_12015/g.22979  ORF Transcript_12015/g.22979 Transcript_12015/m.22979 type:complete len:267 (-) Transcript_12015:340-1140(-)